MFLPHFLEALCEPDLDRVLMGRSVYEHVWSNCEQSAWKGEEKECDRHNNIRQRAHSPMKTTSVFILTCT